MNVQELCIGDTVRIPGGKIGEVSSQCFLFPEDGIEGCLVNVLGVGCIAYNTADLEIVYPQDLIASECDIADEQAALQAAWDELQAVLSYCEQQAAAFAKEDSVS